MAKRSKKQKFNQTDEGGFVYSTNSNFAFEGLADLVNQTEETNQNAVLEIHLEKKQRAGKPAVIIRGFTGPTGELEKLGKKLKTTMGVGGSIKDNEIIIQGDQRPKVIALLEKWGYKTKRVGG